jgi:hypothetical protein
MLHKYNAMFCNRHYSSLKNLNELKTCHKEEINCKVARKYNIKIKNGLQERTEWNKYKGKWKTGNKTLTKKG